MKKFLLRAANLGVVWGYDVLKVLSQELYRIEHGRTVQEAAREYLNNVQNLVSVPEAKSVYKKKDTN